MSKLTELVYEDEVFTIEAYKSENGEALATEWLDELSEKAQVKFAALFTRLGDQGKIFNEQKFKHLTGTDQIFEFKVDNARVLSFFFVGKRVILTHGFTKKSPKTPKREIKRAESIKTDFEQRMKNEKK